jgi:hypothetical protein
MPQYHDLGVQLLSRLMRLRHDADKYPSQREKCPAEAGHRDRYAAGGARRLCVR